MQRHTPKYTLGKWIEPTHVFIAVLLVAAFWLAPVAFAPKETQATNSPLISIAEDAHTQTLPGGLQVASAQGCGACQEFGCVEWINNEYPEDGSDWTTCIVHGCVPIPACVPIPPTATLNVICDTPGQNGWCRGGSKAEFTVTNSQGQTFIISGNVNGNNFACPAGQSDCTVPLPEGTGTVTYVVSTDAGFTTPYSAPYQVDATTPQIDGNINGSLGTLGWYTSQTVVSALASDAVSGIATLEASLDGGTWSTVNSPLSVSDGIHTVQYRATDNAGNQTETTIQQIKVDTVTPVLNLSVSGTQGASGWYVTPVTVSASATDAGSGLAALEASLDGGTWSTVNGSLSFTDGIHTVQFRATDQAGNLSQTAVQEIKVDTITPSLSLSKSGTAGLNGWYVSNVSVTPNASDGGSCIHKIEAMIDGGTWSIVNGPLSFVDGIHSYQIRISDNAGNQTQTPIQTLQVDTLAPTLNAPSTIGLEVPLPYQIDDTGSGLAWFQTAIDDKEGVLPTVVQTWGLTGSQTQGEYWWDGKVGGSVTANVGSYPYRLTTADMAGNQTTVSGVIEVEWKDLLYLELIPTGDNTPLNSTGVIVLSNPVTSNATPSMVAPTPEASFGGQGNGAVAEESAVVTVTGGEKVFEGLTVQAGSAVSFTAGNESTSTPFDNPNILWGAAATALLGATLAEWQKKKEEEAALLALIAARDSGGREDEEEEASDVVARKRAKVMAKNQAKRAQESRWEAARVQQQAKSVNQKAKIDTDEERFQAYKETASYQARQESYAAYYAEKEQEKQNAVNAARWAGLASVAQAKEEEKNSGNLLSNLWNAGVSAVGSVLGNTGGGGLMSVRDDDPPNPIAEWWDKYIVQPFKNLFGQNQPESAPTTMPVAPLWSTPVEWGWTVTPTLTQTITPTPTNTPTPTLISLTPSFYDYGIETIGFDENGRQVVLNAANLTANKLLTVSPDLRYPHLAFAFIHGGKIQIILDPDYPVGDNDENCVVEVNKITCNTLPTEANLIHELGHIFWRNQVSKGVIMIDTVNPIRMSDGTYLDYDTEGNYWFRQPDGFLRSEDSWEHKPNGDTTSGDAKVEHSADMFLNFIYDGTGNKIYGFSLDQYGDARREEMLKILYQVFGK